MLTIKQITETPTRFSADWKEALQECKETIAQVLDFNDKESQSNHPR